MAKRFKIGDQLEFRSRSGGRDHHCSPHHGLSLKCMLSPADVRKALDRVGNNL